MKRILTIAAVALMVTAAPMVAGIDGSKHDLGGESLGSTEICIYCHTPHNPVQAVPLWNHNASTKTFDMYDSATINHTGSDFLGTAGNISALCLSCHDGTVALGNIKNPRGSTMSTDVMATKYVGTTAVLGTDLTNDHPVAFTYDATLRVQDPELKAPDGNGVFAGGKVRLYGGSSNQVECSSCHDVHEPGSGVTAPFLVQSIAGSALCFECHNK